MGTSKVGGITLLYNPKLEYLHNIKSYINQIDELMIFDNSRESQDWLSEFVNSNLKIRYVCHNQNMGVSYPLNLAARYFISKNYEFMLTMDQDSFVPGNMVSELLSHHSKSDRIGIITPVHANKYNIPSTSDKLVEEILVAKTSGNMLFLQAYKDTGVFNENYFIDYVDIEYCMRLKMSGYKVLQCNNAILDHNEADITEKKFLFKKIYPYNHKPIRFYYKTRNRFYLRKAFKNIYSEYFKVEARLFFNNFLKVLFYEDQKLQKLKMAILGYIDFIRGIKGRAPFQND